MIFAITTSCVYMCSMWKCWKRTVSLIVILLLTAIWVLREFFSESTRNTGSWSVTSVLWRSSLSIPASSASVERLFSTCSAIIRAQHPSIICQCRETVLYLRCNHQGSASQHHLPVSRDCSLLVIPASSASVERLFSTCSAIIRAQHPSITCQCRETVLYL